MSLLSAGRIRRKIFGISPQETTFARRGFVCEDDAIRERLERVGATFVAGFNTALETADGDALAARLDEEIETAWTGFAYEGAGMALALLDTFGGDRLGRFLAGRGAAHVYIIHVGAGWILGRVPLAVARLRRRFDPLYGWLALDGYGFHEAFFRPQQTVRERRVPSKVRGYARRGFDQGLGRALWFVEAADPERIGRTIQSFDAERRADLWSGTGLACGYAGGLNKEQIERLVELAGEHRFGFAQGTAFAAEARRLAGNPTPHTELAAQTICGMNAEDAAQATDDTKIDLPPDEADTPAFEIWRRRIQDRLREASASEGAALRPAS